MPKKSKEKKHPADAWVDHFLATMSEYLAEVSQEPSFCGCVFDAIRTPDGKLAGVRVVMCDNVNGNPTRRLSSKDIIEKAPLKLILSKHAH